VKEEKLGQEPDNRPEGPQMSLFSKRTAKEKDRRIPGLKEDLSFA
jgi:hypothetical protein